MPRSTRPAHPSLAKRVYGVQYPKAFFRLIVQRSSAGLGLYAGEAIPKGERIIEYIGPMVTDAEAAKRPNRYIFEIGHDRNIDGSHRGNIARYANHSCKPNAESEAEDERKIFITSKRAIRLGEEITFDYGPDYVKEYIAPNGCLCAECHAKIHLSKKNHTKAK